MLFFDTETLDLKEFFQNGRHSKNSRLWVSTPQILLAQGHFLLVLVYVFLEDDLHGPLYLASKKIYCHELLNGTVFELCKKVLLYKKSGAYQKGQGLDKAFAQSIPIHNLVEWSWADLNCGITGMCCLHSATVQCQVTGTGNWGLRAAVRKYRLGCAK